MAFDLNSAWENPSNRSFARCMINLSTLRFRSTHSGNKLIIINPLTKALDLRISNNLIPDG